MKLLIVDDEPLVQVGLKAMVAGECPDVLVCATASNGKEALELIASEKPDVVFTDIKMPLMDGLTLLRESEKRFGPIPVFVMLTAYEDFDMVREAMDCQAVSYLIKMELSPAVLKDAISLAQKRLTERGGRQEPSLPLEEYREKFLLRLLGRKIEGEETLLSQAADLGLSFDQNRYLVACACLGEKGAGGAGLYTGAAQMAREIVGRHLPCLYTAIDLRHLAFVFPFSEEEPVAEVMEKIQDGLLNAREMSASYFSLPMTMGIGTAVTRPLDLPESYEEACLALSAATEEAPLRLFSHLVEGARRSGKDKLIAAIQSYVEENLEGKLQLSEVAQVFGLSPTYLSTFFKKNAEVGFSEFVTGKKVEKAKALLLEGDMKIYEVADALGFESAYYFSKVFHKATGQSPREFIKGKSAH